MCSVQDSYCFLIVTKLQAGNIKALWFFLIHLMLKIQNDYLDLKSHYIISFSASTTSLSNLLDQLEIKDIF